MAAVLGRQDSGPWRDARDHAATALVLNAGAEAVIALAADNGRLECTFHGCIRRFL